MRTSHHHALVVDTTARLAVSPVSSSAGSVWQIFRKLSAPQSEPEEDGNRRPVPHFAHPAAAPTERPPAAAASRAKTAVGEAAGRGGGRRGSSGGLHQGGHGRRVLPALRHQAHHALRWCAPNAPLPSPSMMPPFIFRNQPPATSWSASLCAGVCNLCNGGVRFVREHDPNRYSVCLILALDVLLNNAHEISNGN